jgi:hypothetical protein
MVVFAGEENLDKCKELGLTNIVFTKVTKSLQNIVSSPEIERMLRENGGESPRRSYPTSKEDSTCKGYYGKSSRNSVQKLPGVCWDTISE